MAYGLTPSTRAHAVSRAEGTISTRAAAEYGGLGRARKIYYNPYLDRRVFGFGFRARLKSLLARPLADFDGTCSAPPFK